MTPCVQFALHLHPLEPLVVCQFGCLAFQASVFGQALDVLPHVEGSAVGAAALARTSLLNLGGLEWVSECVQPTMRVEPCREDHAVYERLYEQYLRIYNLLEKEFTAISQFQRGGVCEYFKSG